MASSRTQQHVGRREVLELVDEQVAAAGLRPAAERRRRARSSLDRGVDLLVEVDGAHARPAARGTGRRRRPGRGRRPARPRPRPGRAGPRRTQSRAPRGRARAGRCWPGAAPAGTSSSTSRRTSRSSSTCGERGPGPRPAASRPSALSVCTRGRKSGGPGLHLLLRPLVVGHGQHASPARGRGRRSRWRRRSVSTRVLPDPAGAMTRAGPAPWATAASWSGARSAVGRHVGGDERQAPELDRVGVHDGPRRRRPRAAPAGRRRPTPAGRRPARRRPGRPGSPSRARAARPCGAHHHTGSPVPGVVGVGPDEEVQPVDPRLEPRARASTARRRQVAGARNDRRVDGQRHDDGLARRPGPRAAGRPPSAGLGQRRPRRSGPRARPPRPRHGPAVAHDDPASERGRTRDGHARTVRTRCANVPDRPASAPARALHVRRVRGDRRVPDPRTRTMGRGGRRLGGGRAHARAR